MDSCPECQATILSLEDAEDTLIGQLRTPPGSQSCLAEPEFQAAVAEAIALPGRAPGRPCKTPASIMPQMLGEYQLLDELGRGGMGRVYKALHTKLDRVVAVKVLPRGRVGDQQAIARFEREMKAVGRLAHPNIVQAYDAREIDGTPVLIMEFVDGLDLAEIVRRVGPLPMADACELVRQTAVALQCAHEHGLVHRDIKPSNIMLARSRRGEAAGPRLGPVLCRGLSGSSLWRSGLTAVQPQSDCHLPTADDEMTGTGQAMGTADYMAPEQASDSRTVDIRADLYSLGCTLYKLLSGRAPFSGPEYRTTLDKLNAHVHQPAPLDPPACARRAREAGRDPRPAVGQGSRRPVCHAGRSGRGPCSLVCRRRPAGPAAAGVEASIASPLPPGEGQGEGSAVVQAACGFAALEVPRRACRPLATGRRPRLRPGHHDPHSERRPHL